MSYTLSLSSRAQEDYEEILRYTRTKWGTAQANRYDQAINAALQRIADNPLLGRIRDGLLMYPATKHCIYYRVTTSGVYILRILHERMDTTRHLPQ